MAPTFPDAPDPACPVEYLPMLLPTGIARELWLPFLRCRSFRPSTPTVDITMLEWNLELESHYQKFHPNTWRILEVDEMDDWKYRYALVRMVSTPSHPVPWADAFKDDLEMRAVWTQRLDDVADRILRRAAAFYALHEARCVYFEHQRKSGKTDAEIIRALPAGRPEKWSTMRNSSLWPLPCCPPPVPGLTIVTRANAHEYRLPACDPVFPALGGDPLQQAGQRVGNKDGVNESTLSASPTTSTGDKDIKPEERPSRFDAEPLLVQGSGFASVRPAEVLAMFEQRNTYFVLSFAAGVVMQNLVSAKLREDHVERKISRTEVQPTHIMPANSTIPLPYLPPT